MSKTEMFAARREAALSPLNTITVANAAQTLRETSRRLRHIYELNINQPSFGKGLDPQDINEFKGAISDLWTGLEGITNQDLQGVTEAEGDEVISFVRNVARLTDDLADDGMFHAVLSTKP